MGTGGSLKRPGCEADHSPPSSAEVKNAWSYTSAFPYVFIAWWQLYFTELVISQESFACEDFVSTPKRKLKVSWRYISMVNY
jgi:hypothetical protein